MMPGKYPSSVNRRTRLVWTLELSGKDLQAYVAVSALDAAWNESELSEAVPITGP